MCVCMCVYIILLRMSRLQITKSIRNTDGLGINSICVNNRNEDVGRVWCYCYTTVHEYARTYAVSIVDLDLDHR